MPDLEAIVIDELESMIEFASDGIVSKTLVEQDYGEVSLFMMSEGSVMSEHTSSRAAVVHALQGKATIQLGEEEHEATPGMWIFMPPHLPHALRAQENFVFLLTLFEPGE